jgi:hypothetical protein
LSELSLLIHTHEEIRVAILDLRRSGLPQVLHAGQIWVGQGRITSLPLVEDDYRVGLYVAAGDFSGNLSDLITLAVEPRQLNSHLPGYAAVHRGVLELNFEVEKLGTVSYTVPAEHLS